MNDKIISIIVLQASPMHHVNEKLIVINKIMQRTGCTLRVLSCNVHNMYTILEVPFAHHNTFHL